MARLCRLFASVSSTSQSEWALRPYIVHPTPALYRPRLWWRHRGRRRRRWRRRTCPERTLCCAWVALRRLLPWLSGERTGGRDEWSKEGQEGGVGRAVRALTEGKMEGLYTLGHLCVVCFVLCGCRLSCVATPSVGGACGLTVYVCPAVGNESSRTPRERKQYVPSLKPTRSVGSPRCSSDIPLTFDRLVLLPHKTRVFFARPLLPVSTALFRTSVGGVPACDIIVGPGNNWVTAAKAIVSGR